MFSKSLAMPSAMIDADLRPAVHLAICTVLEVKERFSLHLAPCVTSQFLEHQEQTAWNKTIYICNIY